MVQNGPNYHFGQNDLIPNRILVFVRPKWTKMSILVHFGLKGSILVHLGPPTVLWPFLRFSIARLSIQNRRFSATKVSCAPDLSLDSQLSSPLKLGTVDAGSHRRHSTLQLSSGHQQHIRITHLPLEDPQTRQDSARFSSGNFLHILGRFPY